MDKLPFTGKHSKKTKALMRTAKLGDKNPFFGKQHSEETKAKISKAIEGNHNPMFGKHHSEETKAKLRQLKLGKGTKHSEETKAKLRESHMAEKNPMWKGNEATENSGRERARRLYPCAKGKEHHHKDGNPLNNSPENIEFVTRKQHMVLDGRLEKLNR